MTLYADPADYAVLPGPLTHGLRYSAVVTAGNPSVIEPGQGPYLGPTFRVNRGDRLRIRFVNRVGEPGIVHWHGLVVPDWVDGHPRYAVGDSSEYIYEFTALNRAGTYWYHPHPDMRTGPQVYQGLAGLFIVSDPEEQALALPRGAYDVPLVIQDRTFDASNQLVYSSAGMMSGWLGDRVLVNGQSNFVFSAATRAYRLRFLNGSNGRTYKLAWSDGTPVTVIGTDAGLLDAPVTRPYVMLAPAERVEIWADFSARPVGSQLTLRSQSFSPGGMGGGSSPDGTPLDIMRFSIDRAETETLILPAALTPIEHYQVADAVNGATFDMEGVLPNEIVNLGDLEAWQITNDTGMAMMQMLHPLHLHGVQFQVYERTVSASGAAAYATVSSGLVDSGWKDTVIIMGGERVKFLVKFAPFPGLFMYHCHILEHEDMGMMRNFQINGTLASSVAGLPGSMPSAAEITTAREVRETGEIEIRYWVGRSALPVALAIHDVSGRRLRSFTEGVRGEGEYSVTWNRLTAAGHQASPGVYFVALRAGAFGDTRKLVILSP